MSHGNNYLSERDSSHGNNYLVGQPNPMSAMVPAGFHNNSISSSSSSNDVDSFRINRIEQILGGRTGSRRNFANARELAIKIGDFKRTEEVHKVLDLWVGQVLRSNLLDAGHISAIFGAITRAEKPCDIEHLERDPRFLALLWDCSWRLRNQPGWFDVRAVATITHSLGKMQIHHNKFFKAVEMDAERIVGCGNTQDIANTAWAFASAA